LIDKIQEFGFSFDGIISMLGLHPHLCRYRRCRKSNYNPVIEVHISNTFLEKVLDINPIFEMPKVVILGFGLQSYDLAVLSF
jgi:3-dehydroquinate dehydratase-2